MAFWFSLKAKVTFYTILVFELLIFQILSLSKYVMQNVILSNFLVSFSQALGICFATSPGIIFESFSPPSFLLM